jgi:RNA polymerase sigma-70 factor (ECF subfamily)
VTARDGSFAVLGQLLEHYRDYLLRIANNEFPRDMVGKIAPSDLVQETFLQAARDFPGFVGGTEAELRAWLRQVLLNNLRDAHKYWQQTHKRAGAAELAQQGGASSSLFQPKLISPESSPSALVRAAEDRQRVQAALQKLPEEYRQVIELRTFDGLQFAEVGIAMNRSSEAARKLWTRAIDCLAEELLKRS